MGVLKRVIFAASYSLLPVKLISFNASPVEMLDLRLDFLFTLKKVFTSESIFLSFFLDSQERA
jgi:hypothetical protein